MEEFPSLALEVGVTAYPLVAVKSLVVACSFLLEVGYRLVPWEVFGQVECLGSAFPSGMGEAYLRAQMVASSLDSVAGHNLLGSSQGVLVV